MQITEDSKFRSIAAWFIVNTHLDCFVNSTITGNKNMVGEIDEFL